MSWEGEPACRLDPERQRLGLYPDPSAHPAPTSEEPAERVEPAVSEEVDATYVPEDPAERSSQPANG